MQLLIATTNLKKGGEMLTILRSALPDWELLTLADFPPMPEVDETGETFMDNARLKARASLQHTGIAAIADDGGLCIDALGGAPGVKSRRFLGEQTGFPEKMARILQMLDGVPDPERSCRFQCAVVISLPDGREFECMGICEGRIAHEIRGEFGFGYDPIFFLPQLGKHMAELPPEQKHTLSHRGKALACAVEHLKAL
jgi:XTP/dITP diphosphohydrolase